MILIDKDIKKLVNDGTLIIENYKEENVNSISYDLTIDEIIDYGDDCILLANEFVIVKTKEKLSMPLDMIGRIEEKNSLLRLGLIVNGPCYQPGHTTYCFLRVLNITNKPIELKKDFKIAQIVFEKLHDVPEVTYDKQTNASFQNEDEYRKFGNYNDKYNSIM